MTGSSFPLDLIDSLTPESSGCGTLLCDPVWNDRQKITDLTIRWADARALALLSFTTPLHPDTRLSACLGTQMLMLCKQLDAGSFATAIVIIRGRKQVQVRLSAIDTGYVAMLDVVSESSVTSHPRSGQSLTNLSAHKADPLPDVLLNLPDNLPGGVTIWQPVLDQNYVVTDFRLLVMNQAMGLLIGKDPKTLLGQSVSAVFPDVVTIGFFNKLIHTTQGGEFQSYEYEYHRDGLTVWQTVSLARVSGNVLVHCQDITHSKRIEADSIRRLELESIISSISSRLINLPVGELDTCILDALKQIGSYAQADQVQVFMCSADLAYMNCLYEWDRPGIEPRQTGLPQQRVNQFAWWHQMKREHQVVNLRSVADLPPHATEEKAAMEQQGIRSMLRIPLVFDGDSRGLISFNTIRQEYRWEENDIRLLKTFAELIVNALKRQQNEETVKRAYQRLQGLHTIDKGLLKGSLTDEPPAITALHHINNLIPCERLLVFRIDAATGLAYAEDRLRNGIIDVRPDVVLPASIFQSKQLLAGKTVNIREIIPNDPWILPSLNLYEQGFRSLVIIPLFSQQQLAGAFILLAKIPFFFTEEDLQVAREVADQLSIALYQQQLRDQVKQHTELLEQRVQERTAEISQLSALQNAMLEHAGLAIISTDATGLIQTVNPATEKLMGYTAGELIGKIYPILLYENPDQPDTSALLLTYQFTYLPIEDPRCYIPNLEGQNSHSLECNLLSKDGRSIPALLTTSILRDTTGQITGYVGMSADISALKTAEANLQQKNRELETFFEGSLDLHCIADVDGTLLKINHAWETTFDYAAAEMLGHPFISFVHPDDRADTAATIRRVLSGQTGERMLFRMRKKNGDYCTIEWNAIAHENLVYASARDVTEQREAEAQLRTASQRLQLATRAARQGVWELDFTSYTLLWDERQHEIHGLSPTSFSGTFNDFLAVVHPDDRPLFQNLKTRLDNTDSPVNPVENEEPISGEKRIIRSDGQLRHIEFHSRFVIGKNGRPEKLVGVSWDVTKRKQTELHLRESEERYRSLVNNLKDIVFQTDITGVWTFLNPAWESITGFTVEESLGQPCNLLIDPDLHPMTRHLFRKLIELRETSSYHLIQYRHKTGSYRWAEVMARVMLDSNGQPTGSTGTITDITERKQTLDALRESEQRFREFAENIDEVFWIHQAHPFQLLYVNPAYERVWGVSSQRLHEDVLSMLEPVLADDKPLLSAVLDQYQNGHETTVQFRLQGTHDTIRWLSTRTFVMRDPDGTPLRYIGIATDITSQKEKELVLQQSLQREQELNKLKSQFVSTASHEFRTPLSTILSSVELIKLYIDRPDASAESSVKRHLRVIEKEIDNFSELLSDILTLGRIDAGKVTFSPRIIDIVALVQDVVTTHFNNRHDDRGVVVQVEGPARPVYIDDKLMTHVLVNILSNAFKFSVGNPALRIDFRERRFCLTITDDGIGIPADDLPHLFETFFRARNAVSVPGSGLGLVITRQFVELHGGTITVCSEENQGTTFTITLPVDPQPAMR